MTQSRFLGDHVSLCGRGRLDQTGRRFQRVAVVREHRLLARVVGHQVHLSASLESQELQDRDDPVVGPGVDRAGGGEHPGRLDGVDTEQLLEGQRPQLEVEAHASAVLAGDVDDQTLADARDVCHRGVQLLSAVTGGVVEDLARFAARVGSHDDVVGTSRSQREVVEHVDLSAPQHVVVHPLIIDDEVHLPEGPEGRFQHAHSGPGHGPGAGVATFGHDVLPFDRLHAETNRRQGPGDLFDIATSDRRDFLGGERLLGDARELVGVSAHDAVSSSCSRRSVCRNWNAARPSSPWAAWVTLTFG